MYQCEPNGQLTLLILDPYVACKKRPRPKVPKPDSELVAVPYYYLNLTPGHVNLFGNHFWERKSPWREGKPPLNTGVAPRRPIRVSLSDILEPNPDPKYYLSTTACLGILRRAEERGKELPEQLKMALMIQAGLIDDPYTPSELKAYHINQRDEGIDLNGVSGALMATNNMQMQTFVTQPEDGSPLGFDGYNGDLTGDVSATLGTNCGMSTGRNGVMAPIAFAANQRDEVRDLHDVASALGAQPGMKQQTFIAAGFSAGAGPSAGGIGYSERVAPTLKGSAGGNCMPAVLCLNDQGGQRMDVTIDQTTTLRAQAGGHQPLICLNDQGGGIMECSEDISGTLRAQEHGHQPLVLATQQGGTEIVEGVCPTITTTAEMSGSDQPVLFENHGIDSRYTGPHPISPTLSARAGTGGNNLPLVSDIPCFCITGNAIDRQPQNGGNGIGYQEDIAYTLTATDHHAVYSRQRVDVFRDDDVASTESARQHKDATDLIRQTCRESKNTPLLIRRLTPLECERLQGFLDRWTNIPGASDSSRYKALGNSVAIPCVEFIMRGIAIVV